MDPRDIGAGVNPALASVPHATPASNAKPNAARPDDVAAHPNKPAFHVLLERLQAQASELEAKAPAVDDAEQLAGAVGIARASLDEAATLTDRLLEAFREAEQQKDDVFSDRNEPRGKQ